MELVGLVLLALYGFSRWVVPVESAPFLVAGIFGVVTFIAVDGIGKVMNAYNPDATAPEQ